MKMKMTLLSLIVAGCIPWIYSETGGKEDPAQPKWVMVWNDEFDGSALDQTKWNIINEPSPRNNELHYYTPDDVYLEDGLLKLRSQKREYKGSHYTSGGVTSEGKFHFQYGKVEIRAKLPRGQGIWPAHWAPPIDNAPYEIDITEMLGHEPNKIYLTSHWLGENKKQFSKAYKGPDYSQDFHTFSIEWEPGKIRWLIDGIERHSITEYVQDSPSFLFLNTAVGGNWPGNPDHTTVFPQYHEIDYVRIYTQNLPGE